MNYVVKHFQECGSFNCKLVYLYTGKTICETCNKSFTYQGHLIKHRRIHSNEISFIREICEKGFASNSELRRHKQIHSRKKFFICKLCEKFF